MKALYTILLLDGRGKRIVNKAERDKERQLVVEMSKDVEKLSASDKKELMRLRCRTEFMSYAKFITREVSSSGIFQPYDVHKLICNWAQNVSDGNPDYQRTAISLPPRTGKSLLISRLLPSFALGRSPSSQHILASYALKLTTENSRSILEFVTSEAFQWLFPECTIKRTDCNLKVIRSQQGGIIMSASAGSGVTGFGFGSISNDDLPGLGILDDVIQDGTSPQTLESTWGWVSQQFGTRMLPNYALMSVGTRFHVADTTGRLIESDPERWKVLNVPALCIDEDNDPLDRKLGESHWPEFFPSSVLESIKKQDQKTFDVLYQGQPQGEDGSIYKLHWFEEHENNREHYEFVYATADTALKKGEQNDSSVICIFGVVRKSRKLHLIHVFSDKLEFPELLKIMPKLMKSWKVRSLYIEARASGLPLIQMLRKELQIPVKEVVPTKDKVLRANEVAPIAEEGRVSLYSKIPGLSGFISELTSFPYVKSDDFTDAFCSGLKIYRDEIMGSAKTSHGGSRIHLPQSNHTGGNQRLTSRLSRGSLKVTYL